MRILCTARNPSSSYCGKWVFGAKQMSLHYKLVHADENSDNNSDYSDDEEPNIEMHPGESEDNDSSTDEEDYDVIELPSSDDDDDDYDSGTEVGFSSCWLASLISDRCFQTHPRVSLPPQGEDILFGCAVILLVILNYWMA